MAQHRPRLQENIGWRVEDSGTPLGKNGEQSSTYLPTGSEQRWWVVYRGQAQIRAALYAISDVIVWFDTQLGNVSYFSNGQRKGRQTWRVKGESGCASRESHYIFPFSLLVSFGFRVFLWVYEFHLGLRLCLSIWFMLFLCSFGFGYKLFLCSFGCGYKVLSDGQGEVRFAHWVREELWWENQNFTTTTT